MNLLADLLNHLSGELDVLIAAPERPGSLVAGELVVNGLPHRKFVHILFQQAGDDLRQFHNKILPFFVSLL